MAEYDIKKVFMNAIKQIKEFSKNHQGEHFYAFAIDAGMLCLSSEEGFNRIIETYSENWQKSHEKIRSREDLDENEFEIIEEEYKSMPERLLKKRKINNLREYIDYYLEIENEVNQNALEKGNPYKNEEKVISLRYNTGDWPYQGFGKLDLEDLDSVYEEHYIITEEEQQNSEYSQLVKNLLNIFNRNKDNVFTSLKCTKDFEVLNAEHKY